MSDYGKETVTIVEVDMPFCQLEYGTTNAAGTCAAQLGPEGGTQGSPPVTNTGTKKCFQSRVSCQDPLNYLPATQIIRFSHPQRGLTKHYDNVFPCLIPGPDNPSTTPGAVNLGGMDRSMSALGVREAVDIEMSDFRWNDHLFDKYRLERISGDASLEQEGTAQAGSANSLTLAADAIDVPVGRQLRLPTGPGSVQERQISAYDGGTKVATVSPRWRVNALSKSSAIDHANWTKQNGITITANFGAAPDGTLKAERVQTDGISLARYFQTVTGFAGKTVTFTLKMRSLTGGNQNVRMFLLEQVTFDPNYGGQTVVVTPFWQTFSLSAAIPAESVGVMALVYDNTASLVWDFLACEHQFNEGSTPGEFIETDAAAITLPDATTGYEVRDAFDPYERGSFAGKFLARNPYHANYRGRVKQGFMGDALADMRTRSYIVDRITGPTNGKWRWALKDLFSLIEARKAVAPIASQGELDANITDTATTATLSPAGIGNTEYPASGYVAIGSEVIKFTRSADVLTFLDGSPPVSTRGSLDTEAKAHDAEDLVQLVYNVEAELAHDIIYELLTVYAEIPAANIDKAEWDILAASMTELYTGRVTEPTPVRDLIGEICQQAGCTVWHDPATDEIRFQPLRPTTANVTVNDRDWIIDGTYEQKPQTDKRVSQAHVYAGQIDPTKKLDDKKNFRMRVITPDLDAESATQYGVPSIKELFSRWIPQFGRQQATAAGERIIALFRDPPLEASFRVYRDRAGQLDLAQPFLLQTFETQDDTGAETTVLMAPVELERGENEIGVRAQGVKFFTAPDDTGEREVFLDSPDMRNLNLRTVHDSIYAAPVGDEVIRFILPTGFLIGSTSATSPSVTSGSWPPMTTPPRLTTDGEIRGAGGQGGAGGSLGGNGAVGQTGGTAIEITVPFEIDNLNGILRGGAGGGGGGGSGGPISGTTGGGGGGGGGQGTDGGPGGGGGQGNSPHFKHGSAGGAGTPTAAGGGGAGGSGSGVAPGGNGGSGGALGSNGSAGANGGGLSPGSGGAGGSVGDYISGDAFVTWINTGTRIGGSS